MYYEINVAKLNKKTGRYEHFFATSEESITNAFKLEDALRVFVKKFPKEEGYQICATHWQNIGKEIEVNYKNLKG